MLVQYDTQTIDDAQIVKLVVQEREKSLSSREWQHRIAGYGYAIKQTDAGPMIANLLKGDAICALPTDIAD